VDEDEVTVELDEVLVDGVEVVDGVLEVELLVEDVVGAADVLVDEDVEVVVVEVVVLPDTVPKPAISMIAFPPVLMSSQVLTKSESGWIGSKTRPNGGVEKALAKSASVGVLTP